MTFGGCTTLSIEEVPSHPVALSELAVGWEVELEHDALESPGRAVERGRNIREDLEQDGRLLALS